MLSTLPPGTDNAGAPSNYQLLMNTLCYYFYSYVSTGKPYPRSFPGEAMERILSSREAYESAILALNAMAVRCEALWREIAQDCRTNIRLARRYAWDAAHVKVLTADYLTLLRIYDIYCGGVTADTAVAMAEAAGERRLARLALMEEFERVKEPFLAPSHLRNHSIYMPCFAALEA